MPSLPLHKEPFVRRAFRTFGENTRGAFTRIRRWWTAAQTWVERHLTKLGIALGLLWLTCIIRVLYRLAAAGRMTGVGEGGAGLGMVFWIFAAVIVGGLVALVGMLLTPPLVRLVASLLLSVGCTLWAVLYLGCQILLVAVKLLLLLPLLVLFIGSRLLQLWRNIFHTCPSRACHHRGLPQYVCPRCQSSNRRLWPNLHGLLWHPCVHCDGRLPTIDLLGRGKLSKRCGRCDIPLVGRHAGRAPERLVAIVGGPGSGKTNYLLMAVRQMTRGNGQRTVALPHEIDDPEQAREFAAHWEQLESGFAAAKTAEAPLAFLLYGKAGTARCQLYLYDAPGEEFESIGSMSRQQYFPLLEGFILMVDPDGLPTRLDARGSTQRELDRVVASIVATAGSTSAGGKLPMRVAVVLAKADREELKGQIGDIRDGSIAPDRCREALCNWGGRNAVHALEQRFDAVNYFACSALGRSPDVSNREPFRGMGLLEPLEWLLVSRER